MIQTKRLYLLLISVCSLQAHAPFDELLELKQNTSFMYEQQEMPSLLRRMLTIIDVSCAVDTVEEPAKQRDRFRQLLRGHRSLSSARYVAREYAPHTYNVIVGMSQRLNIETPLVFVAHDGDDINTAYTSKLPGGYHAVVFGERFLQRSTPRERQAVAAHELAHIARKHCQKEYVARKVWLGVVLTACMAYGTVLGVRAARKGSWEPFNNAIKEQGPSWLKWGGLVAVSWVISEALVAWLSRKYEREADRYALQVFDGTAAEYIECLSRVQVGSDELRKKQRAELEHYFSYVEDKIKSLRGQGITSSIIAFLLRRLHEYEDKQRRKHAQMPKSMLGQLFASHPSLDDRIAALRATQTEQGPSNENTK